MTDSHLVDASLKRETYTPVAELPFPVLQRSSAFDSRYNTSVSVLTMSEFALSKLVNELTELRHFKTTTKRREEETKSAVQPTSKPMPAPMSWGKPAILEAVRAFWTTSGSPYEKAQAALYAAAGVEMLDRAKTGSTETML